MNPPAPWSLVPELPWQHFSSPITQWQSLPSFVIGEYLFMACALAALWHAWRQGRRYLLVWVAALIAGTANDLIFMALPMVDNFWQAQATVMITPRLPLYIPCVYVCFMYFPTVSVWRLGLPPLARAALTGLIAILFYAPYDIVGAKFLWWTWHESDPRIAGRLLGAPLGSTIWVITFVASFAYLLNRVIDRDPGARAVTFLKGVGLVAALSSVVMVLQMTVLQLLDGGVPGVRGLVAVVAIYAFFIYRGARRRPRPPGPLAKDRLLLASVAVYFTTLIACMALFEPKTHVATGIHQTYGPCNVKVKDFAGLERNQYACADAPGEQLTFECGAARPVDGSAWYTVCGVAHDAFTTMMTAIALLGALGIAAFWYLLKARGHGETAPQSG